MEVDHEPLRRGPLHRWYRGQLGDDTRVIVKTVRSEVVAAIEAEIDLLPVLESIHLEALPNVGAAAEAYLVWTERQIDLGAASSATLTYVYGYDGNGSVVLEVSPDGGASWTALQTYTFDGNVVSQQNASFDLTPYAAPDTRIRFYVTDDAWGDLGVDDLEITYTVGDGPAGAGGTVRDEFNASSFANNDGSAAWAGSGSSRSTCASFARPIATCRPRSSAPVFAWICTTGSRW